MKKVAIIQARYSSTRLRGKVLLPLPCTGEKTVLAQVVSRVLLAKKVDEVVVASSTNENDVKIKDECLKIGVPYFAGSENDVLKRYYECALNFGADVVIRITSDCPLIDPHVIDDAISLFLSTGADYVSNGLERTFPRGFDVEVFSFDVLKKAFENAKRSYEREHVTPYIYDKKNGFLLKNLYAQKELSFPNLRLTLDTIQDYALLCTVYDYLYRGKHDFFLKEVISLFKEKPWLSHINEQVFQKKFFENKNDEIREGIKILEFYGLKQASKILKKELQ